jgi:glycosyltransferase involved in cell wall biosynthesis
MGLLRAGFRRILDPKAETIRFLIVSDGRDYTSEQQFAPFRRYAAQLERILGVHFCYMRLSEGVRIDRPALAQFSALGIKVSHRSDNAAEVAAQFRERAAGTDTKLLYFDGDDDVCVQWPEILELVDLYVKKGIFASKDDYLRAYVGKSNLTDYVWTALGTPPGPYDVPSSRAAEPGSLEKIYLGWSIALDDKIAELFARMKSASAPAKDLDVVCRSSLPKDWLFSLRNAPIARLDELKERCQVLLPTNRVSQEKYYEELRRSRICVSPLGYGELCWRDFEAIICGCLLVKPDMSHLRTNPDIFVPGETYVPVRWDYSDLAEKCLHYLDRADERTRITDNAYRVLDDYYGGNTFIANFAAVLDRLGLRSAQPRRSV